MSQKIVRICFLTGGLWFFTLFATAQEVVHAMPGKVSAINPSARTMTITTDDGSQSVFRDLTDSKTALEFNKKIRAETIAADVFKKSGDGVIVFYYGMGSGQTAVAVKDLGAGPFEQAHGSVVKLDRHNHILTIKNDSGASESFHIGADTVAESDDGAVEGLQFSPNEGEPVTVTAQAANGSKEALFVGPHF
jgi:phosphotransferase system IIA component